MGRHEQREQVFRLLFRVEYHAREEMPEQVKLFFEDDEEEISEVDHRYISDRYQQIEKQLTAIDQMLNDKVEGWDTARMGKVELTILRLAVFEICFDEDVPGGVAINEAVELAKRYGQAAAGGFVNAILAKFV